MQVGKRHIKDGSKFDRFFQKPKGKNILIKKRASLEDTIRLMKKVIPQTLHHTKAIAEHLKTNNVRETLKKVWDFTFHHLQYEKDEEGKEQVRSPARTWYNRKQGVDCDCMSEFIGSILTNLNIPYALRITKYIKENGEEGEFEHVYPIAYHNNQVIIMDTVVHQFNYEVPYSSKKDITMELEYLNGVPQNSFDIEAALEEIIDNDYPADAEGLLFTEDLEGLEGRAERKARKKRRKQKRARKRAERRKKGNFLKRAWNSVKKVFPATALLRAGILASMKLNVMNVASKLRFAYWAKQQAARNNMNLGKYQQLQRIKTKLETIYRRTGGNPHNLKKAILSGKGNRDRQVTLNGLGELIPVITDNDSLRTILGEELFATELYDVNTDALNGLGNLGELGEPATAASVASASAVIATIAQLIQKLGNLFNKGTQQADQEIVQDNTAAAEDKRRKFNVNDILKTANEAVSFIKERERPLPEVPTSTPPIVDRGYEVQEDFNNLPVNIEKRNTPKNEDQKDDDPKEDKGVIAWVKKNPVLTGLGAAATIGLTWLIIHSVNKNKDKKEEKSLNGAKPKKRMEATKTKTPKRSPAKKATPKKKTTKKRTGKTAQKPGTIQRVEML